MTTRTSLHILVDTAATLRLSDWAAPFARGEQVVAYRPVTPGDLDGEWQLAAICDGPNGVQGYYYDCIQQGVSPGVLLNLPAAEMPATHLDAVALETLACRFL